VTSQQLIVGQIPWATSEANKSRAEVQLSIKPGEDVPFTATKEEKLLEALLAANQELFEAFRMFSDLERLYITEREEREVHERSKHETRIDRSVSIFRAPLSQHVNPGYSISLANAIPCTRWILSHTSQRCPLRWTFANTISSAVVHIRTSAFPTFDSSLINSS
jgi:hypothetical protein